MLLNDKYTKTLANASRASSKLEREIKGKSEERVSSFSFRSAETYNSRRNRAEQRHFMGRTEEIILNLRT